MFGTGFYLTLAGKIEDTSNMVIKKKGFKAVRGFSVSLEKAEKEKAITSFLLLMFNKFYLLLLHQRNELYSCQILILCYLQLERQNGSLLGR